MNGFDNSRIRRPSYQSYDLSQLNVYRNHIGMDEDEASWEEIIGFNEPPALQESSRNDTFISHLRREISRDRERE